MAVHKNLVTRALGADVLVRVDIQEHCPLIGDIYLMCSDGLTEMLDDATIAQVLNGAQPLSEKVKTLIHQANAAGGRDNISVLLAVAKAQSGAVRMFPWLFRRAS